MRELSHQLGWCLMCCQPGHWATNCPNLSLSLANTPPRPTSPVPRMGAGGSVEGTVKEERQRGKRRGVEPLPLMPKEGAESLLLFQPLDQAQGLEGDEVSTAARGLKNCSFQHVLTEGLVNGERFEVVCSAPHL